MNTYNRVYEELVGRYVLLEVNDEEFPDIAFKIAYKVEQMCKHIDGATSDELCWFMEDAMNALDINWDVRTRIFS